MGIVVPVKTLLFSGLVIGFLILLHILIGLILIFVICYYYIRKATKPLKHLAASAGEVAQGRFDTPLPSIKNNDEIHMLRDSFEDMQHSLAKYIKQLTTTTAQNASMERELNIARNIQMSMLPKPFPANPKRKDIDVYGMLNPAKAVGGDLYDFFIRDEHLFFCIGDVSGKGVPASLVMAVNSAQFRTLSANESRPSRIISTINESLASRNESMMFVTLFVGILDLTTGDCPLSTLAQTYEQIYKDLDEAISLYQKSGLDRDEDEFYKPNINVAYAVYARAAITREDWANAAKYAALARKGHELMTNEQYAGGMHTPNNEWIFGVYEASDQTLHYYSFFAYQGSNSSASICRNYPCAISKELIDQIPATDVRRNLFLVPSEAELKECNSAGRSTKKLKTRAFKEYGNKLYSTSYVFAYMQFKLTADFMPGGGSFPLFRSAEMYYIEAEADCHLGKDAEAQKLLFEANQERDPELKKSEKTGADLLTEVKLYRRFDLWGEGYDWFDYKRWGQPINRKALNVKKGLESPGSFHSSFAKVINPEDQNDWTWMIPEKETDYNGAFKNGDSTED